MCVSTWDVCLRQGERLSEYCDMETLYVVLYSILES